MKRHPFAWGVAPDRASFCQSWTKPWSLIVLALLFLASWTVTLPTETSFAQGFATATPSPSPTPITPTPTLSAPEEPVTQVYLPPECAYVPGQPTRQACLDIMAANPKPNVTDIRQDSYTLGAYSFWRVGPEAINTYSAPGGQVVGQIPAGFNFVNAINTDVAGWLQIEGGEWISRADADYKPASRFTGVLLPDGWHQPFGWILDTTGIWASTEPGAPGSSASGLVPRHYERFNIFAEAVDEEGWTWYMVGPNQWVKQIYMTVIQPVAPPEGVSGKWVAVDLFEQSLVAYEDERPVFATLISTGLPGTETNEGVFTVWARLDRDGMSGATGAPTAYALQSVPWTMYFDGGISLHGTYWHDTFGYRRSRGCVNLSISDANWVYNWSAEAERDPVSGVPLTYVYVYSTGEYR